MIRFIELDENVTLADQLQKGGKDDGRSVIMINKFNVKLHDVRGLMEAWAADAAYLKQKQGFNYAQLHRGMHAGACLSTTRCGNLWNTLIRLPVILLLGRLSSVIQKALRHHHIYSEKLLCMESVWTDSYIHNCRKRRVQEAERIINYLTGYIYLIVRPSTGKRRRSIFRAC